MATDRNKIIIGSATLSIDAVDVGHTTAGVNVRESRDFLDIEGDQIAGVIQKEITFERMFITTTLLETTLERIRIAMNMPSGNIVSSGSQLDFGSASPAVSEHQLIIVGKGIKNPNGTRKVRTFTFFRCISINEISLVNQRDAVQMLEVEFECLKDETQNNKFGNCVEV